MPSTRLSAAAQVRGSTDTKITLERIGACCLVVGNPVYRITIAADGSVLYEGKAGVHAIGTRRGKIQPAAVSHLAQRMAEKGFFDFSSSYGVCEDGGMVTTSLELEGRSKLIKVHGRLRAWLHWPWRHS